MKRLACLFACLSRPSALLGCGIALSLSAAAQPTPGPKAGRWQIVSTSEDPSGTGRQVVRSVACVSEGGGAAALLPRQAAINMTCRNDDVRVSSAGVAWRFACSGPDRSLNGTGTLAVGPTSASGAGSGESRARGAKPDALRQTYAGHWVSADCR